MKLFYFKGACSLAPHIALKEIEADFELVKYNREDKSEILKFNPKGLVPTLVLQDGKVLTETAVIMQYIADLKPSAGLIPKQGSWDRFRCLEWLNYVATELHKGWGVLFRPDLNEETKSIFRNIAKDKLKWLDHHFTEHKFLMGDLYTVADIYAFVILSWSKFVGVELNSFIHVNKFLSHVKDRPATLAAIRSEK